MPQYPACACSRSPSCPEHFAGPRPARSVESDNEPDRHESNFITACTATCTASTGTVICDDHVSHRQLERWYDRLVCQVDKMIGIHSFLPIPNSERMAGFSQEAQDAWALPFGPPALSASPTEPVVSAHPGYNRERGN